MKEQYIELLERVFSAYTYERLQRYKAEVFEKGITEHGFARVTANLGFLIAHGRRTELTKDFLEMMDFCCEDMVNMKTRRPVPKLGGNVFTVKDVKPWLCEGEIHHIKNYFPVDSGYGCEPYAHKEKRRLRSPFFSYILFR